jgi:L-asparaginase
VAYAVSLLEDDELYNAGIGSQIQSDGIIRMSAAIMNGETQKMSGVINIQDVKNPILLPKN